MMEVSPNMELSELPTEEKKLKSITVELKHKDGKLTSTPTDIKTTNTENGNAAKLKASDEDDDNKRNSLDASDMENKSVDGSAEIVINDSMEEPESTDETADISNTASHQDRDTGSDLEDLLHKISSIVDCEPKKSAEKSTTDTTIESCEVPEDDKIEDTAVTVTEEKEKEEEEEKEEEVLDSEEPALEPEANTDDKETLKDVEVEEKLVENSELDNGGEAPDEIGASKGSPAAVESKAKEPHLNSSKEDEFMDALETISSSSDEVFSNKSIEKVVDKTTNGLEEISSDDSSDIFTNFEKEKSKSSITYIDLDSSDECVVASDEATVLKHDNSDLEKEEPTLVFDKDDTVGADNVETETTDKMDVVEAEPADPKDEAAEEPKSVEETIDNTAATEETADTEIKEVDNEEVKESTDKEEKETADEEVKEAAEGEVKGDTELVEDRTEKNEADSKEQESDDEVIFFEPIEKGSVSKTAAEVPVEEEKPESDKAETKYDEVVLLSEDEDEAVPTKELAAELPSKSPEKEAQAEKETETLPNTTEPTAEAAADSELLADNSDNACDQFDKSKAEESKPKSNANEEIDSNSSSNLLQPSQKPIAPATVEPSTVEVDEGDVEMIADEEEEEPEASMPANKRPRLSTEDETEAPAKSSNSSNSITNIEEDAEKPQPAASSPATAMKRVRDFLADSPTPEKEQTPNKKLRIDDSDSSNDGQLQIDLDAHDNTDELETPPTEQLQPAAKVEAVNECEKEEEVKEEEEEEVEQIELQPKPELKSELQPLRLEFVRNFRKSFDQMTRSDLEELVLQKVVESMLVKSEFADIRRQVDKYEIALANYRRKIAEVSKQFLDLDTVHKRVLKDLETKNAQFIAPVRITRAVGLQVGTSIKKQSEEMRAPPTNNNNNSMPAPAPAPSSSPKGGILNKSPGRSPLRGGTGPNPAPAPVGRPSSSSVALRGPQPGMSYPPTGPSSTPPVRRGCMQKITPQRPVNNVPASQPSTSTPSPSSSGLQRPQQSQSRGHHLAKLTSGVSPNTSVTVRSRPGPSGPLTKKDYQQVYASSQKQQQLQQQQQQQQQQQLLQQQRTLVRLSPKMAPTSGLKVRSLPMADNVSVSIPNASVSSPGASSSGYAQPTLAPAKPKEKAVIDLTDEDDAAAAAAAASSRLRQNSNVIVKRTLQTNATPTASAASGARSVAGASSAAAANAAGVVRMSPMARGNTVARQLVSNNPAAPRSSLGSSVTTNVTMQIRSENTPPTTARLRYSHPAPLPTSPPQAFNPALKLPPSRPVIRISLHDTGIVISWTLEDTSARFANCVTYQIYAYQETIHEPSTDSWRHVGDVKAMLLPMAVTLNQFQENQRYYFAVRGVDDHKRYGAFSAPKTWS